MKPLLFLLLLSVSFSCLAQENDRAVIVKNKVKVVTIKANESDSIGYFIEYNSKGLIIKKIGMHPFLAPLNLVTKYNYNDTLLINKIETVNHGNKLVLNDTTFYEYDQIGRLITEYEPQDKKSYGCIGGRLGKVIQFIYEDTFSLKLYKKIVYCNKADYYKNSCQLKYKDGKYYYLDYYEIYKYIQNQSEPLIYRFDEYWTKNNKKTNMFYNTIIEGKKVKVNDTTLRYESYSTLFNKKFLKYGLICDENETLYVTDKHIKTQLLTINNSRIVKEETNEKGLFPSSGIITFYYNEKGLINNAITSCKDGTCDKFIESLFYKSDNTYFYEYEYFQ